MLVCVLDGLDHIERLRKQHEENCLTPADGAYLVLAMKQLKDIEVTERAEARRLLSGLADAIREFQEVV